MEIVLVIILICLFTPASAIVASFLFKTGRTQQSKSKAQQPKYTSISAHVNEYKKRRQIEKKEDINLGCIIGIGFIVLYNYRIHY